MKLLTILFAIVFLQAEHLLNNKIQDIFMRKIETRDFVHYDLSIEKTQLSLHIKYEGKKFYCKMCNLPATYCNEDNYYRFEIKIGRKSIKEIIAEMDEKVQIISNGLCVAIEILYKTDNYIKHPIMRILIKQLKKLNLKKKTKQHPAQLYYETICDEHNVLRKVLQDTKAHHQDKWFDMLPPFVGCYKNEANSKYYIILRIYKDKIYFFFEFCLDEVDYLMDKQIKIKKTREEQILDKFRSVYEFSYDGFLEIFKLHYILPKKFIFDEDEFINYDEGFIMRKKREEIIFHYNNNKCIYLLENNMQRDSKKNYISKDCFAEFETILSVITNDKNSKVIYLISEVLKKYNKVQFYIQRILKTPGSASNIIFAHLLKFKKIIDENTLNMIIEQKEYSEIWKIQCVEFLSENLTKFSSDTNRYLIFVCLILEGSKFISENDLRDDNFLKTIKEIGNFIASKNSDFKCKMNWVKNIEILEVFREIVNIHTNISYSYKNLALNRTCCLVALYSEERIIYVENQFLDLAFIFTKEEVIINELLDKNKIWIFNFRIKEKLISIIDEDKIKLENYNKIIQILSKHHFFEKWDYIIFEVILRFSNDIYGKAERIKMEIEGKNMVENIFQECKTELLSLKLKDGLIDEYKNHYMQNISLYARKYCTEPKKYFYKKYFKHIIVEIFKNESNKDEKERLKFKIIYQKILETLSKDEVDKIIRDDTELSIFMPKNKIN
ncbi:uncharacterized protein VNE69_07271 [Vairimorpha necatrix]|uniref:Uncharacterized protein n=1 Tax=Vairimorpha necatrix TaxID=6039 RepID=A0AAX4JDY7_9MICR